MHELWICRNILEIIKEYAVKQNCTRVKMICLEVGELTMIDKQAILFNFDVISKGTIAENTILKFIDITGQAWCDACQTDVQINRYDQPCANCGGFLHNIKAGEELRVKSMEVE